MLDLLVLRNVVEVYLFVHLKLPTLGKAVALDHQTQIVVNQVSNGVGTHITEVSMHVIVLQGSNLCQEAEGVATDQAVPFKEHFCMPKRNYLVLPAVQDHQETADAAYCLQHAETVVAEG